MEGIMRDNKTSQAAANYDDNVQKTIPRYTDFHDEALSLVKVINNYPSVWLDTGCGTGSLIAEAAGIFENSHFVAADPSEAMLEISKEKLAGLNVEYLQIGSESLSFANRFDAVTAIMAHHYLSAELRKQATEKCFAALKLGGVYVTFETIKPFSERGTQIGMERWRLHQLANGKPSSEADKHLARYGVELLPISIIEHVNLLKTTGFSVVEILWASGLQAGFYAIK
jgi:tRNA (cmo5U34)-methyltransferase